MADISPQSRRFGIALLALERAILEQADAVIHTRMRYRGNRLAIEQDGGLFDGQVIIDVLLPPHLRGELPPGDADG